MCRMSSSLESVKLHVFGLTGGHMCNELSMLLGSWNCNNFEPRTADRPKQGLMVKHVLFH